MHTADQFHTQCQEAIAAFEAAAIKFRGHSVEEMLLQHTKPLAKHDAICRIMATENKLTGKAHTATSAEAIVEADAAYAAHLQQMRIVVGNKLKADSEMQAAKLRAQIATAGVLTFDVESSSAASLVGAEVDE